MGEHRIDDLAREAGITVRTVRSYVTRGLLPPPARVEGRTNFYDDTHLARLRVIAQLLARNYTLDSIAELISAREAGQDLGDIVGLEREVARPWHEEEPLHVTRDDIVGWFGVDDPVLQQAAEQAGYLVRDGDGWIAPSARLIDVAIALVDVGVPLEAVLELGLLLKAETDRIADAFITMTEEHVWVPFEEAGMPAERVPVLTAFWERIRPLADAAVLAHLAAAVDEHGERLVGRLAESTPTARPPAQSA